VPLAWPALFARVGGRAISRSRWRWAGEWPVMRPSAWPRPRHYLRAYSASDGRSGDRKRCPQRSAPHPRQSIGPVTPASRPGRHEAAGPDQSRPNQHVAQREDRRIGAGDVAFRPAAIVPDDLGADWSGHSPAWTVKNRRFASSKHDSPNVFLKYRKVLLRVAELGLQLASADGIFGSRHATVSSCPART
jgi:hypothetical protein